MKRMVSPNALANRRLYLKNTRELITFSAQPPLHSLRLGPGFVDYTTQPLEKDIVSRPLHRIYRLFLNVQAQL